MREHDRVAHCYTRPDSQREEVVGTVKRVGPRLRPGAPFKVLVVFDDGVAEWHHRCDLRRLTDEERRQDARRI